MPVVKTKGSASSQGFGEFAQSSGEVNYIDDVFSTYLYTGTGSTQTITNGIDLATEGGLVWIKKRAPDATNHSLVDSARGVDYWLRSNQTAAQISFSGNGLSPMVFNTNGFTTSNYAEQAESSCTFASWTFRKQPKFFDVVTYTGNGANRTIAHNLVSEPGMIIVKPTNDTGEWICYHRSLGASSYIVLNTTAASVGSYSGWANTAPTSTVFSLGGGAGVNASGVTYVAYLFAHDAGGFGTAGTDNVISCGSYVDNTTGTISVNLGYEPQWILAKPATSVNDWFMVDVMRGDSVTSAQYLYANKSNAEMGPNIGLWYPTATGFSILGSNSGDTWIYIAIRRPMKPPTTGTEVFSPVARTGNGGTATVTAGFAPDLYIGKDRNDTWSADFCFTDRLRGTNLELFSNDTSSELSGTSFSLNTIMTGVTFNGSGLLNGSGASFVNYFLKRAPGFFDEVCYTGTGSARTVNHNLSVAPELVIVKSRSTAVDWITWNSYSTPQQNQYQISLNTAGTWSGSGDKYWGSTTTGTPSMTSTTFSLGDAISVNGSGSTYVAYLFATVAGVSKVGSYTGTGTVTQTINAGFGASGARYVLIKRTDSTGNWYVFDSARGFTSSSSPYLRLNSTAAEVTGNNGCYAASTGFTLDTNASATVNVNGASYIYLAVA